MSADDTATAVATIAGWMLRYSVNRYLQLYRRTGVRAFIWRCWRDARRAGEPVPEAVLAIIDGWAQEPPTAGDARRMEAAERRHDVLCHVLTRQHADGLRPGEADADAADVFGLTEGNVRTIKSRWRVGATREHDEDAAESRTDIHAVLRRWPR